MDKARLRRALVVSLAACLAIGLAPSASSRSTSEQEAQERATLFAPHAHPYGLTYAEWLGENMEWFQEIPAAENPALQPGQPTDCALQGGVVVFVGQGPCRVPRGAAVAIGTIAWECSTAEGLGRTFAELRRCAIRNWHRDFRHEVFPFTVHIDGRRVRAPRRWTFVTPGEIVMFPEDNVWGAPAGPSRSVTKGILYILRPLPPGTHTLRLRGRHEQLGPVDLIYRLTVGNSAGPHASSIERRDADSDRPWWFRTKTT
jgi:hypothetical protein